MFYKTRFNPLINGSHLSYIDKYCSKYHTIRLLKKYTKINTTLFNYGKVKKLFKSNYYLNRQLIIVKYYGYKSNKKNNNIEKDEYENYIKEFINKDIKIIWRLKCSPFKIRNHFD
jgi:hypothetical protein